MHARAYLERNSCLFLLSQKSGPAISRGGRVGWTGRFWGLGKLADSVVRNDPRPDYQGGARRSSGCISYRNTDDNQVPTLSGSLGWRCRITNDQTEGAVSCPQQYQATRNPTRAVSGEYLKKKPTRNILDPTFSGASRWRCRMANRQNKQRHSFVPPSSTEPQGTRPR